MTSSSCATVPFLAGVRPLQQLQVHLIRAKTAFARGLILPLLARYQLKLATARSEMASRGEDNAVDPARTSFMLN